jgi:GYF domain 2
MSPSSASPDDHWYYATVSGHAGPITAIALRDLLRKGVVAKDTLVWNSGFGQSWKAIRDVDFGLQTPPPLPKRSLIIRALEVFASVLRWAILLLIALGVVWWFNLPESPEQKATKAQLVVPDETPGGVPIERDSGVQRQVDAGLITDLPAYLRLMDNAVRIVRTNDYHCDSITDLHVYLMSRGFEISCNHYAYAYKFEDKGRGFEFERP